MKLDILLKFMIVFIMTLKKMIITIYILFHNILMGEILRIKMVRKLTNK